MGGVYNPDCASVSGICARGVSSGAAAAALGDGAAEGAAAAEDAAAVPVDGGHGHEFVVRGRFAVMCYVLAVHSAADVEEVCFGTLFAGGIGCSYQAPRSGAPYWVPCYRVCEIFRISKW